MRGSGVQDRDELPPEALDGVVIGAIPQDQTDILGTTPPNNGRLLGRAVHGFSRRPHSSVRRRVWQRVTPLVEARHSPTAQGGREESGTSCY
jgi:hypothetical protein